MPTPRSAGSSTTMSGLEGSPSASSSGVAGSATVSINSSINSVEAGSAAASAPGSDDPVDGSQPAVLQPPSRAETTISGGNRHITVTLEQPVSGKRKLKAWCWRFVSRFTPTINEKNVVCLVKKVDGTTCNHLMKWAPSEGNKRGTGTSGMTTHIKNRHPDQYKEAMKDVGTTEERKAPVTAAIAGHSSAGASSGESLPLLRPKMDQKRRDFADLRFVIWCCVNLRPEQMRYDDGFKLFVGALAPEYVNTAMVKKTFNTILATLHDRVKKNVMDGLRSFREECLAVGYSGAFLGAQLDLMTAAGEEYITFSVSYVCKGSSDVTRVALATRAFPGMHTADDIRPWIEALTQEYFADFMGEFVEPKDVFLAFTVDQGGNVVNACEGLGVEVIKCNCHRVNSAIMWSLGIAGSSARCKNKPMGELMKKLAACVGVWSHSAVSNDKLKELQKLEEDFHAVYELIRRNDTRWTNQFKMMDRVLALKKAITEYFRQQAQNNARKLTSHEWTVINEVCSLLDEAFEATIRMQEAKDTHVSQAMFIMYEVIEMLKEETQPIRVPNATVFPTPPGGIPTEMTEVTDLTPEAQGVRDVLLEVMEDKGVGKASLKVERLCALLDPRRKSLGGDQLVNGSAALRVRAEVDLNALIAEFEDARTQPPAPVPAPVANVAPVEPSPKRKKPSRLEERRAARVAAAVGTIGSGGAEPQASVTGRRVLIGGEALVYLAEPDQIDVDGFNLLEFWSRRGTDSVCPTTGKITSPAEMPYLAFLARLYHGVEATSCQAERNFSALAHLIGDLRSNMLASKVERMMFIRLNRHLVNEVHELDAANAQARARVAKSAQKSAAAQQERSSMSVDLAL